jgi:hypothetical protein
MTKTFKLLFALAFMLIIAACKKSDSSQKLTVGTWSRFQTGTYGVTAVIEEVHFNDNGNMIQRLYLKHMTENRIIGYYAKREAKYRENNGVLELTNITEYGDFNDTKNYADEKDLVQKAGPIADESLPFTVTDNSNVLTIGYLCPPNAFCARPYWVYTKVR